MASLLYIYFKGGSDREATMEDLKSMNYMECCIKVLDQTVYSGLLLFE